MVPVPLTTTRLMLSPPTDGDVDAIHEACQDPDTQRYTTVPSPYERHHAEQFPARVAREWDEGTSLTWAMREGDALVGMIGLHGLDGTGAAELGYWVSPWSRRRGLVVEAARAVLDWGFAPTSPEGQGESAGEGQGEGAALQRIEWRAVVGNLGSARAARALGFRYEGMLRRGIAGTPTRDDAWIAGLLADDDRSPQPWPVLAD